MGPSWDALGVISSPLGNIKPGVILAEAKSQIPEIYGGDCQASAASLPKIRAAMHPARGWCGCTNSDQWPGPLYQSANRIAHLYFLREKLVIPGLAGPALFHG
jgi:hypothetical protein